MASKQKRMNSSLYHWLSLLSVIILSASGSSSRKYQSFRTIVQQQQHHHCDVIRLSRPDLMIRGGSTTFLNDNNKQVDANKEQENNGVDTEEEKKRLAIQKWKMDQQNLMQLRSFVLSECLAKRGIPLPTLMDISTADGEKPPEKVDWDCAMSTEDDPKPCLYSFDAEPNTKVIGPIQTEKEWISLSALNRLRRTDPSKVEGMWHSKYSILQGWFDDDSEFTLLQHIGIKGLLITLLLDSGKGLMLTSLLILSILTVVILFMPMIEFFTNRFLVSGLFWSWWPTWGRFAHAALPLKLLIGQMAWKAIARAFSKLESKVREYIVDVECAILEERIPLTVGPGSEDLLEDVAQADFEYENDDDDEEEEEVVDFDDDDSDE